MCGSAIWLVLFGHTNKRKTDFVCYLVSLGKTTNLKYFVIQYKHKKMSCIWRRKKSDNVRYFLSKQNLWPNDFQTIPTSHDLITRRQGIKIKLSQENTWHQWESITIRQEINLNIDVLHVERSPPCPCLAFNPRYSASNGIFIHLVPSIMRLSTGNWLH